MASVVVEGRAEVVRVQTALTCAVAAFAIVTVLVIAREVRARLREGFWFDAGTVTARGMLG